MAYFTYSPGRSVPEDLINSSCVSGLQRSGRRRGGGLVFGKEKANNMHVKRPREREREMERERWRER